MNTQLLMSSGDIETICSSVIWIVAIIAGSYLIQLFLKWLLKPCVPKTETPPINNDNIVFEREQKRQDRVRALMREICELTKDLDVSKGDDGQYNDVEAQKLFDLYKQIDAHVKLPIKTNENEQQ